MKIVYLIAGIYRSAGMERVVTTKANWLSDRGHSVLIVTSDQKGRPSAFPLHDSIRTVDLGIGYEDNNGSSFADKLIHFPFKQLKHRARLSALLKKEHPDITISTFCNDASFLPGIKDGSHKLLEVHFSRFKKLQYGRKGLWSLADRIRSAGECRTASRFERFVVLTREDASYWGDIPSMEVIPNPRTFSFPACTSTDNRQVLAAGRYDFQKGFDLLLKAWAMVDSEGWTLRIAGEGHLPEELLKDNVVTGPSDDIREEYLNSSIFALSSRYEGLPMVLLEAQAAGLPCVCFRCKCGPSDIITDGKDGLLVEEGDIAGFASALQTLMDNPSLRESYGRQAFRNSVNYDIDTIMRKWEKLFEGLL